MDTSERSTVETPKQITRRRRSVVRSPVAKLPCEAATEENAKRRRFMPRTQVTSKANSPGTC